MGAAWKHARSSGEGFGLLGKHVVIHTIGSLGDLYPFLRIGQALKVRGHRVTVAALGHQKEKVEQAGLDFHPVRPDVSGVDEAEIVARIMDPRYGPEYLHRHFLYPAIADTFHDLLAITHDADLLLSGSVAYAAPIVAAMTGVPWVSSALQPGIMFSAYDPPVPSPAPGLDRLRVLGPLYGKLLRRLARKTVHQWAGPVYRLRSAMGLPRGGEPIFEAGVSPLLHLVLFSERFGKPCRDWPRSAQQCGFVFDPAAPKVFSDIPLSAEFAQPDPPPRLPPEAPPDVETDIETDIETGIETDVETDVGPDLAPDTGGTALAEVAIEPLIRIAADVPAEAPAEAAAAGVSSAPPGETPEQRLERFTYAPQRPLLFTLGSAATKIAGDFFVTAIELAQTVGRNAVLIGEDAPESWRLAGEPEHCVAFHFLPYEEVFGRAALVIHQGGIGTTAEALRAGVPMLVVPFGADQYDNAERVRRLGSGLWLPRKRFDMKHTPPLLGRLLDTPSFAEQAVSTAAAVRAEDGLKQAIQRLETVLNPPPEPVAAKPAPPLRRRTVAGRSTGGRRAGAR